MDRQHNPRVLVVDDNDELRDTIALSLSNAGYQVSEATDGEDALEKLDQESFRLMVLDVMMPRVNGLEVLQKLEGKRSGDVPAILVVSQLPHIEGALLRFKLPNVSFLAKPFESGTLLDKVVGMFRS